MTTDTLAWVRAEMDAVAVVAEAASSGPWHVNAESDEVLAIDGITVADGFALSGHQLRSTTAHIARHDPAAVLRRIAADRKLLELHHAVDCGEFTCDCADCCAVCRWTEDDEQGTSGTWGQPTRHVYPCPTVRLIAEGYGWTGELS